MELSVDTGDGTVNGPKEENLEILVDLDETASNKNISLKCTTNVTGSLDFTMHFKLDTSNTTITLPCPKESGPAAVDGNFIISRQDDDCILTIMNVSQEDTGNYSCKIFLSHSNSPYNNDWSNSISLVTKKSPVFDNETTLGLIATVFFVVVVAFIVLTVIAFVTDCAGVAIYIRAKSPKRRGNTGS